MVNVYCREIKFCDQNYYFRILRRFYFRIGAELPKIWAGSKIESMLEMKIIYLVTKFNFATIAIYHTFALEKDSGPQLFLFFSKKVPEAFLAVNRICPGIPEIR